jgi:hypothetical protein
VVAAVLPLGVTVAGENEQVLSAGNPLQAKLTWLLKPPDGVTDITVVPLAPPATDTVDGATPTEKLDALTACVRMAEVEPA